MSKAGSSKGGQETVRRYGEQTMAEIGRKGGESTAKRHGTDHYQRIGKKGGEKMKRMIEQGKEQEQQEKDRQ